VAFKTSGAPPVVNVATPATATLAPVHWMFTGLLIGASGATAVYTFWLVRRLFTTPVPAADDPLDAS
jgi:hypothetical protein